MAIGNASHAPAPFAVGNDFTSILRGRAAAEKGAAISNTPLRYSAVSLSLVDAFREFDQPLEGTVGNLSVQIIRFFGLARTGALTTDAQRIAEDLDIYIFWIHARSMT